MLNFSYLIFDFIHGAASQTKMVPIFDGHRSQLEIVFFCKLTRLSQGMHICVAPLCR